MPSILQNHYVLAVPDAPASARFYVERLGFRITAEPPGWVFVERDGAVITLGSCPADRHPSQTACHNYFAYLRVDDARAMRADLAARGATGIGEVADKPWGMREFAVTTPDGHRIMFGERLTSQ